MSSRFQRKSVLIVGSVLLITACGKSTIDAKQQGTTYTPPPQPTVTVTQTATATVTSPPSPTPPPPSDTQTTTPSPTQSDAGAPKTIQEFLALLGLDQSFSRYTTQIKGENGKVIGYHMATNGQKIPPHRVPPGLVLDFSPDGTYIGSENHAVITWIDNQCGQVMRLQVGNEAGNFSGTVITYYWTGWSNPPAAPDRCPTT